MVFTLIFIGFGFMALERLIPDQKLPHVPTWWGRVILINAGQVGVIFLAGLSWDRWFQGASLFHLGQSMSPLAGGIIGYLVSTFVYYWWHRWRHQFNFLWVLCHQLHHSPARIETITSFYKHPVELVLDSILSGALAYALLGLTIDGALWVTCFSAIAEYLYHMNVRTPQWVGYFFQRPEMHRIHHERGRHYDNFSDLPLWDMLFGTYQNPKTYQGPCGFKTERELSFWKILSGRNVNGRYTGGLYRPTLAARKAKLA